MLQHKYFLVSSFLSAFILPALIAWIGWNDFLGGLLYGGFVLRIIIWHCIFSINSFSHYIGTQEFSTKNTSRGNMLLAFITQGEGHHNFHHEFAQDYRNGILKYDWDPTKWVIQILQRAGLAWNLLQTPEELIQKARENAKSPKSSKSRKLALPVMTKTEMMAKIKAGRLLIIIDGFVVDVEKYLTYHPGGAEILNSYVGCDATDVFHGGFNKHTKIANALQEEHRIARFQE